MDVDHIVSFGSTIKPSGTAPVRYRANIPDAVRGILPTHAVGQRVTGKLPNGDFWYFTGRFTGNTEYDFKPAPADRFFPGANPTKTSVPMNAWHT